MHVCSVVFNFATPWAVALQAPLSMDFPRQDYWSVLTFSSPGDIPKPRDPPASPTLTGRFIAGPSEKSCISATNVYIPRVNHSHPLLPQDTFQDP